MYMGIDFHDFHTKKAKSGKYIATIETSISNHGQMSILFNKLAKIIATSKQTYWYWGLISDKHRRCQQRRVKWQR
jgi:hypothetical protein